MIRIVEFETRYPLGRDPIDWVKVAPMGEAFTKTQTWHRVQKLNPARFPAHKQSGQSYEDAVAKWSVIGPAYDAWKSGNELPAEGTPLEVWAALTKAQVKMLKALDVRTIEDVRDIGDATLAQIRMPNARQLPKLANEFLSGADGAAKDERIDNLEEQLAAALELLEEQQQTQAAAKKSRAKPKTETESA